MRVVQGLVPHSGEEDVLEHFNKQPRLPLAPIHARHAIAPPVQADAAAVGAADTPTTATNARLTASDPEMQEVPQRRARAG
jgi:hypothetical protein